MSNTEEETAASQQARPNLIARIFRRRWYVPVALVALVGAAVVPPLLEGPDLVGTYVLNVPQATVTLTLEGDGVARVQPPGSAETSGTWELNGNEVTIEVPVGNPQVFQLDGNVLIDPNGQRWVKTDGEPVPGVEVTDQPTFNPATDELESALKNAATAMESYAVDNNGNYSRATLADLMEQGLALPPEITLAVNGERAAYCIEGQHEGLPGVVIHYNSDVGTPEDGPC